MVLRTMLIYLIELDSELHGAICSILVSERSSLDRVRRIGQVEIHYDGSLLNTVGYC